MSNPYAEIFYNNFKQTFLTPENAQENAANSPRILKFVDCLNTFLTEAAPEKDLHINPSGYKIDNKKCADYILSIRAQMIASSKYLPDITEQDTRSPEIIEFFENIKDICIASSSKLYEDFDYDIFKLDKEHQLLKEDDDIPDKDTKNIFFFGVNRSNRQNMEDVNYYFQHATKDLFKQAEFANTEVYSVNMPTCFPEEIAASTILKTINYPQSFNDAERYFVEEYWSHFVGKDLSFDEDGKVAEGEAYSPEELEKNLSNIKIFSYCAGAGNAHRCLNALKHISQQLYDKTTVENAWKKIDVISFAFPLEAEKSDYNHISLICNDKDPTNPETVVKTNFPSQYKQIKLNTADKGSLKITNQSHTKYIALQLNKNTPIFDHNGNDVSRQINNRNGHRLQNITKKTPYNKNFDILMYIMKSCLKNEPISDKTLTNISRQIDLSKLKQHEL